MAKKSEQANAEADAAEPRAEHLQVEHLSYEQAREELVGTVRSLEAGNLPLEESLRLWERGEALADHCQAWLDGARRKLETAQAAREAAAEAE